MVIWRNRYDDKSNYTDIVPERNSINLKYFIENHIEPGTNISHYGWPWYSFPNDNHYYGPWGTYPWPIFWQWSSFHKPYRAILGSIKIYNKKNYSTFIKTGFVYYVGEAKLPYNFHIWYKLEESKLEKKIWKLFKDVYELCNFDFMTEEEIMDNNTYDI